MSAELTIVPDSPELAAYQAASNELHYADQAEVVPESFADRVARLWKQYGDPETKEQHTRKYLDSVAAVIADVIFSDLRVPDEALAVLDPCVQNAVRMKLKRYELQKLQDRGPSKKLQKKRNRAGDQLTVHSRSGPMPDINDPLMFLELTVTIDGTTKKWKYFTAEELEARRLRSVRHARIATQIAQSNAWALAELKKHGAACLNDIHRDVLMKDLPDTLEIRP